MSAPLVAIAKEDGPAEDRLRRWLDALVGAKHRKVFDDPELFATYHALAEQARGVVDAHVQELVAQLRRIVADGAREGVFGAVDPDAAARAVFDATVRFHHPAHSGEWHQPGIRAEYAGVVAVVVAGLRAGAPN